MKPSDDVDESLFLGAIAAYGKVGVARSFASTSSNCCCMSYSGLASVGGSTFIGAPFGTMLTGPNCFSCSAILRPSK